MHFLYDHIGKEDENLGSVKQCVNSIDVSTFTASHTPNILVFKHFPIKIMILFFLVKTLKKKNILLGIFDIFLQVDRLGGVSCLTDENTETYWESDGMQGQHWIRLHMKRGTVVK